MNKISIYYVVLCLYIPTVLCVSEEMQEIIDMLHNTCKELSGATEESIVAAQKGNFMDDNNLRCYMKCIMTEMSTMSDDGIVDVEAAVALLPPEERAKLEPTMRKCGTQGTM
ncbi:hypothetical protein RN001_007331 [Aquatica leii]|uniref:Uncharacterized protein n=1 Tax=Aquatica leii TaxID=1421715 RepID=A0AAN7Q491_9COLE|nr:hypothetical protein RN001_007331 [Aquatica leii]